MIAIVMMITIGWYAGWRMSKEDWTGANSGSTCQINERW